MAKIGSRNVLNIIKDSPQGPYLDGGEELGEILLPGSLAPKGYQVDDSVDIFLYRDSEDRLVATTQTPLATVDQAAYLQVIGINRGIGAFLDWGLDKDLLLPFRESKGELVVGDGVVVYVFVDSVSDRIVASMRLDRHIGKNERPRYTMGQEVDVIVERQTPLGYAAIVNNEDWGMLYYNQLSEDLEYGQSMKAYVVRVRPDGKIDLRRDPAGYDRVVPIREAIIHSLREKGGKLPYNDKTPPEVIREVFDVSKKAFKQAIGALYKEQEIVIEQSGIRIATPEEKRAPKKNATGERSRSGRSSEKAQESWAEMRQDREEDSGPKKPSPWDNIKK